ncbi:5'-3' exoribonuclease pacman [Rhynchophorus ferrugineus]|uniref:5'-3' exoribonuclease pacman n=1 Tax=Rhynchophorus ferrugineus TaxID=354439 RepID=UPI003FCE1B8E
MGVPKFFRFISERYPCLSEVVKDYQIPEFDNMYLDMNGIIHICSHPDDNNPHFRITEEKIFKDIFHYLEVLFRMIRPRKLFFMAIDGVAPRAKMNQQRGRRFRSAKDAEKMEREALKKGEALPTEARFDSNCITPGTIFMARLHSQLKYFVTDKVSNDPLWRDVTVILSGHETPGEGEHKIMDYIRYLKAQPGYDPNTRHCLYGLDADLIMLGLCTHEPHFSLLREEIKYGKKSSKRDSVPEEITFFLLHLSLMREYIELEFQPVKDKLVNFKFDLENIIDDWVLMGFLVGNDFIPHLPNLHIANGALPTLYKAYMEVLPTLDGYINEAGTLNLVRFEKFMQTLANIDLENFEEIRDDLLYMEAKTGRKQNAFSKVSSGKELEPWSHDEVDEAFECLELEPNKPQMDSGLAALIQKTNDMCLEDSDDQADDESDDIAFENFKKEYYKNKLEYAKVTPEVLRDQAEGYVKAIQWNLNYYYNGVCSWSWYYPHHYAPYISDIKGFSNLNIEFDLGAPFKPYEQLLAVLPPASQNLLPTVYHSLMTSDESPLKKFYPDNFLTDLNGKRQEWEAVVLLPFLDEEILLKAMRSCNEKLTPEEKDRNTHGPMYLFSYTNDDLGRLEAPDYFPVVRHNHAKIVTMSLQDIRIPKEKLIKGIYPGAVFDIFYPGFPTMKHLQYVGNLEKAKIRVFNQASRYESMILNIISKEDKDTPPLHLLGTTVFVSWPHLVEARVVAISTKERKYHWKPNAEIYSDCTIELYENDKCFATDGSGIIERYKDHLGIKVGKVRVLCHVQKMIGRKYVFSKNGRLTLEKQFAEFESVYPLQTIVSDIAAYDEHQSVFRDVLDVFQAGAVCFTLCNPYYGSKGTVLDSKEAIKSGRIKISVSTSSEPDFTEIRKLHIRVNNSYRPINVVASQLGMGSFLLSRITGSVYVSVPDGEGGWKNVNVGLDLKFTKKNYEVPGYTRKVNNTWYYSDKCTELVKRYSEDFPAIFQYFSHNENAFSSAEEIFGDNWETKLKELKDWLKSLPSYSMEKRFCGSVYTDPAIVKEVESTVDNYLEKVEPKKITMQVKPIFLYKPELIRGNLLPDDKMDVELFDRVVNIRNGYTVPFGLKGTVIFKSEFISTANDSETMYDIVFDEPFDGGLSLSYCSPGRGYRLPKTAFINISYGTRLLEKKMGKQDNLMMFKQRNDWNNPDKPNFFNQTKPNNLSTQGSAFASFNQLAVTSQEIAYEKNQQSCKPSSPKKSKNKQKFNDVYFPKEVNNDSAEMKRCLGKKPTEYDDILYEKFLLNLKTKSPKKKKNQSLEINAKRNGLESNVSVVDASSNVPFEMLANNSGNKGVTVDPDFFNNLLRINSPQKEKNESFKLKDQRNEPQRNVSVKDTSSTVSFEMLAEISEKALPSVKLSTYYQSNNLGMPRYQYLERDNVFTAQISLPNKELIIGQPAKTKADATENVATMVLKQLIEKSSAKQPLPHEQSQILPEPPKTWMQPLKSVASSTLVKVEQRKDQALKTALNYPFVPTQVIKRQTSKNTSDQTPEVPLSTYNDVSHSITNQENVSEVDKATQNSGQSHKRNKKHRSRRSRIAANFPSP